MNGEEIIKLLGKPLRDPDVQELLKFFYDKEPEKGCYAGQLYGDELHIHFSSRKIFEREYLKPPYEFDEEVYVEPPFEDPDTRELEFIVASFTFSKKYKSALPFGLNFSDPSETVQKLGKSLGKSKTNDDRYVWEFLVEPYKVLALLDKYKQLEWVSIWLLDNATRTRLKRKETVKTQNKNINADNLEQLHHMKNAKPTDKWYEILNSKDNYFEKESIDKTVPVLDEFIDNMIVAATDKKAVKVLSSIKKVILALNQLEQTYEHIATGEREDLVDFIFEATRATGFQFDDDITLEWRNW